MANSMDRKQVMETIPHRPPFLLIDEVTDMVSGESVTAKFYAAPDMEVFKGHFPGAPVFPGAYSTECMAQAAAVLLLSMEAYKKTTAFLLGANNVSFKRKISPGDTLEIRAKMTSERKEKAIATCQCEVFAGGALAACGEVTLAMR